jgi:hypothetical protein
MMAASMSWILVAAAPLKVVYWDVDRANLTLSTGLDDYEAQALIYALQGIVNRPKPSLFFDLGSLDKDNPSSEKSWRKYLAEVNFEDLPSHVCALTARFSESFEGSVFYPSDSFSIYAALTFSGLNDFLPVSNGLLYRFPCLRKQLASRTNLTLPRFPDKFAMYRWGIDTLLPNCSKNTVFNANYYRNADVGQSNGTLMSVDYAVSQRAFVMNLCPLWKCGASIDILSSLISTPLLSNAASLPLDPIDCGPNSPRVGTPRETALFVEVQYTPYTIHHTRIALVRPLSSWRYSTGSTIVYDSSTDIREYLGILVMHTD